MPHSHAKHCRVVLREDLEKAGYNLSWYYSKYVDDNGFDWWRASFTTNYRLGVTYEGHHWKRTKPEATEATAEEYHLNL
jgi:hypothetical protein